MKPVVKNRKAMIKQRGAALVVGLIMLLLLTLIGVAGMRNTLLQQKMVANTKDREIALQAAESALRAAELTLSGPTGPTMTNTAGLYDATTASPSLLTRQSDEATFWKTGNWATWTSSNSQAYNRTLDGVSAGNPPRYVIEKLDVALSNRSGYASSGGGCTVVCSEDLNDDFSPTPPPVSDYRVTVRAVGSTTDAVVLLQSTFRRDKE